MTVICPVVTMPGIDVEMLVAVAGDVANVLFRLTVMPSLLAVVSKFVPVIETGMPGVAIVGVKPVIVGSPLEPVTMKAEAVAAVPAGDVTEMLPFVAPVGTLVTI